MNTSYDVRPDGKIGELCFDLGTKGTDSFEQRAKRWIDSELNDKQVHEGYARYPTNEWQ
jgi:hypothetical protein